LRRCTWDLSVKCALLGVCEGAYVSAAVEVPYERHFVAGLQVIGDVERCSDGDAVPAVSVCVCRLVHVVALLFEPASFRACEYWNEVVGSGVESFWV